MRARAIQFITAVLFVTTLGCLTALVSGADEKRERPAWTRTLTESQRNQFEHMHHELDDDQAPHKQKEAESLAELNAMTIREDADLAEINAKIDELMAAKTQIMRLRYEHLVEMRRLLTDEQKVGYDKGVLKRSAVR
ncbi:MAG: Spy/CpxP family protein refolding chaperone [Myxococcota bacterium]|jgi:Spy/CpxP family protein refolding chaperone|nr:Spy/CpxP family protein refolding chaperone [Myxococcota bacterium]